MSPQILNSLTWQDAREIVRAADEILDRKVWDKFPTEEAYYTEVLNKLKQK